MVNDKDLENTEENLEIEVNEEVVTEESIVEEEISEENIEEQQSERETQLKDQLIRLQADFTNYRRRSENEKKDYLSLGAQKVILDLLSVIDNFERALSQVSEKDSFSEGIELIHGQLIELIKKYDVEEISETNVKFDPNMHHGVLVEEREGVEEGLIIEVLQKGYKMNDKVLRPAMVKVSQ
ncbi:nucleotide exchange factor GrpE [Peptoniphilus indolicus]|uniref:Protein GrpE n=2 Tax=Peptoniphilus indolicus TaxID=33030 RepID=G4D4H6_9FIRM|nr:chaperone GrpE [Peptoniphilus indolicus ATCC 29427]SUB75996.1 HSP-70 cofactor [Peptoniphilus indolicus]